MCFNLMRRHPYRVMAAIAFICFLSNVITYLNLPEGHPLLAPDKVFTHGVQTVSIFSLMLTCLVLDYQLPDFNLAGGDQQAPHHGHQP